MPSVGEDDETVEREEGRRESEWLLMILPS